MHSYLACCTELAVLEVGACVCVGYPEALDDAHSRLVDLCSHVMLGAVVGNLGNGLVELRELYDAGGVCHDGGCLLWLTCAG